jgi:hypothetical protein
MSSSSNNSNTTTISSVLNTCLVSSVLDAMPFLSSSDDYNIETENLLFSKTFPYSIQGSIDLEPESLSTYYNLTIRPIIQQAFASHTFFQQEITQRQAAANAAASALSSQTISGAASFLGSFMSALGGAFSSHSHTTSLGGTDGIVIRNGFSTSFTAFANDPPGIGYSITPWTTVQVVPIDRLTTSLNSIGWTRRIASSIVFNCFSPPAFQGMPPPQVSCNIHIDTTSTSMKQSKSRNLRIALRTSILSQQQQQQQLEGLVPPSIPLLRWSESQYITAKALEEKGNNEFEKKREQFETSSKNTFQEYQTHPNSLILLTPASSALFGPIITTYGLRGLLPIFSNPRAACSFVQPAPSSISESTQQYVLFALRGGCTFAKKALVAQSSGYSALLVMDLLSNDDYAARGGEFDFIMADDSHFTATPSSTSPTSSPLDSTNNPSETQQHPSTQQSSTQQQPSSLGVGLVVTIPAALVSGESAKALSSTFLHAGKGTLEMIIDEALSIKEHGWELSTATPSNLQSMSSASVIHSEIEFFPYQTSLFGDVLNSEESITNLPPSLVPHHSKVIADAFSHAFETLENEEERGEHLKLLYPNPFADYIVS